MAYLLAVDAGGTKAEFLLAENGRELARARTGTIKRVNADAGDAERNLEQALAELEQQTGVAMSSVVSTCIGTSGSSVPLVTDWLHANFGRRVGGTLTIVGDEEIALDAAFQGGRGVLALAGTGSNLAARDAGGNILTAGGWGPMLADQGSGHWIGMEALRRGFLARDEERPTEILERARRLWNLPSIDALIEFANAGQPQRYASQLAREVVAAADEGDAIALEILDRGGAELAYLALLVIERMRRSEGDSFTTPRVAMAGSILASVARVRTAFQSALRTSYADIGFVPEIADPVRGALWRAMQSA
ncbi:MAG: N-acetylglucosamine kinase [Acidobacteriota bacterium]